MTLPKDNELRIAITKAAKLLINQHNEDCTCTPDESEIQPLLALINKREQELVAAFWEAIGYSELAIENRQGTTANNMARNGLRNEQSTALNKLLTDRGIVE